MKDRIVAYVAQGVQNSKIAEILGCSDAYIAEVKSESWFSSAVEEFKVKIKKSKESEELEDGYVKLETKTLKAITENLPFAEFRDLTKLMDALVRRRQASVPNGIVYGNQTVNNNTIILQVPQVAVPEIIVNPQREVIAVGERSLAPMPSSSVRALFKRMEEEKKQASLIDVTTIKDMPDDF